jgi:RNA polymerase sigma-70 factor (ECF subfamily)
METRIDAVAEDEQPMEFPDDRWDPEGMVLTDELVAQVDNALETMSEKLRSVLLLHDKEDMAYDEIAQTLNLPIGTVKSRLFLARNHLQQSLMEYVQGKGN